MTAVWKKNKSQAALFKKIIYYRNKNFKKITYRHYKILFSFFSTIFLCWNGFNTIKTNKYLRSFSLEEGRFFWFWVFRSSILRFPAIYIFKKAQTNKTRTPELNRPIIFHFPSHGGGRPSPPCLSHSLSLPRGGSVSLPSQLRSMQTLSKKLFRDCKPAKANKWNSSKDRDVTEVESHRLIITVEAGCNSTVQSMQTLRRDLTVTCGHRFLFLFRTKGVWTGRWVWPSSVSCRK